jgi:hypothetical protein
MNGFRATIEKGDLAPNSWCFVVVPDEIAGALDGARRVRGTIAGKPFEGALQSRGGGRKTLLVKRELRDLLGLVPGDVVDVAVEPDVRPRTIDVPDELAAALDDHPHVARAFAALAPSHRREYADWIAQAKKPETKRARVERALSMIPVKQRLK